MICPSCGSELPDGTDFCPNCGSVIPADTANEAPAFNVNNAIFNGGSANNSYSAPSTPIKKSSSGSLIGIIVAVAVIALLVGYFLTSGKYMGTYKFDSVNMSYQGQTVSFTPGQLGMSSDDMMITVGLFNKVTLVAQGDKGSGKIKISGNTVTLSDSSVSLKGTYNKKDKSITIPFKEFTNLVSPSELSDDEKALLEAIDEFDEFSIVFKK